MYIEYLINFSFGGGGANDSPPSLIKTVDLPCIHSTYMYVGIYAHDRSYYVSTNNGSSIEIFIVTSHSKPCLPLSSPTAGW